MESLYQPAAEKTFKEENGLAAKEHQEYKQIIQQLTKEIKELKKAYFFFLITDIYWYD